MKYQVTMLISVDPEANFLETNRETNLEVIQELLQYAIFDIDDIKVHDIDVTED